MGVGEGKHRGTRIGTISYNKWIPRSFSRVPFTPTRGHLEGKDEGREKVEEGERRRGDEERAGCHASAYKNIGRRWAFK